MPPRSRARIRRRPSHDATGPIPNCPALRRSSGGPAESRTGLSDSSTRVWTGRVARLGGTRAQGLLGAWRGDGLAIASVRCRLLVVGRSWLCSGRGCSVADWSLCVEGGGQWLCVDGAGEACRCLRGWPAGDLRPVSPVDALRVLARVDVRCGQDPVVDDDREMLVCLEVRRAGARRHKGHRHDTAMAWHRVLSDRRRGTQTVGPDALSRHVHVSRPRSRGVTTVRGG